MTPNEAVLSLLAAVYI